MNKKTGVRRYLLNILISIDQFVNTVFGGSPDETISSAVGRKAIEGRRWALILESIINPIFAVLGDDNHCRKRIEWDEI